ncbi:glycosyltransferase family 2 protein [Aestuariivirga sp.]|uniref:glycosyltransferase family 2 protein n=1 Tax=Aestuariivirga sp. TaxID=2650926 RepID=UPI003BAD1F01
MTSSDGLNPLPQAGAPAPAIVVPLWGEDLMVDKEALASFRALHPKLRLYAILLDGAELPGGVSFDRIIRLPLARPQLAYAESIVLQLCFGEGGGLVGVLRALGAADLKAAEQHLALLAGGGADAVLVTGAAPADDTLFLSERASFLASLWSALSGELLEDRVKLAAGLLGLAGRRGVSFNGAHAALPTVDLASFAAKAALLRSQLGLTIGTLPLPRAQPIRRVAVVTPYYKEPGHELQRAIGSVRAQTSPCDLILVSDGFSNDIARQAGAIHIELGVGHGDGGNAGRYVGAMVALAKGYDAVAFLDADNWYEPKHIQRMVQRQHETGATAVVSGRNIYLPDGFKLQVPDEEDESGNHVDTSCYLLTRACEYAWHLWGQMPPEWGAVGDRVLLAELAGQRLARTGNRTMNYKSNYAYHYRLAQRPVPEKLNAVPLDLVQNFFRSPQHFRQRSINRTGRVIRL